MEYEKKMTKKLFLTLKIYFSISDINEVGMKNSGCYFKAIVEEL